jgi:hypothetical protein
VLEAATDWLCAKLTDEANFTGLLGYKRTNPAGILNQAWKDSSEFYIHEDGRPINHDGLVVSVEVQGYVYDALQTAARYLPHRRKDLKKLALNVQQQVLQRLWLPDCQYFALGIDGSGEVIRTRSANGACLLNSDIFKDLPWRIKRQYVAGIVKMIFSDEFLTNAGIRSRGFSHRDLISFSDYHGSDTTWFKETGAIRRGLINYGFGGELSRQLGNRVTNATRLIAENPGRYPGSWLDGEFGFVDENGFLLTHVLPAHDEAEEVPVIVSTNKPQRGQAWTIAENYNIENTKYRRTSGWQRKLEGEILETIVTIPLAHDAHHLECWYPPKPFRFVDKSDFDPELARARQQAENELADFKMVWQPA